MLEAAHLYKQYTTKTRLGLFKSEKITKQATTDISLTIPPGKIIGVLGENGAGKTTLIKMLTTLLLPDSGTIQLDGEDINQQLKKTRKRINMIAGGERNIYWRLNALENLHYFGSLYELPKKTIDERSEQLLKQFELWEKRHIPVEQFSKGMKQRLQIAKGLINNPDYLFLDEPTLGLDVQIAKELRQTIKQLATQDGKGILLTTHYMAEAEELCDYIYIIDNGAILLSGTKEEIFSQLNLTKQVVFTVPLSDTEVLNQYLSDWSDPFEIIEKDDMLEVRLFTNQPDLRKIINFFSDKNIDLLQIEIIDPTLESALLASKERSVE
ncbi:ABC transporter ATP-binding protein [Enterococcus sp. BWR-S5]|uniref:ABC transporter ATP-binding protein n=1 Tax=Enterococcus sp. BWR-S5 TaxID=2787714 RepID=UPI0019206CAE|nr:ABC transporter ATP-binding protein [Enterococcus sp. BWR-S5]MBL1226121.1 ABC transporter ATP-binding protein [Enterococcus sp. BWR-S5]